MVKSTMSEELGAGAAGSGVSTCGRGAALSLCSVSALSSSPPSSSSSSSSIYNTRRMSEHCVANVEFSQPHLHPWEQTKYPHDCQLDRCWHGPCDKVHRDGTVHKSTHPVLMRYPSLRSLFMTPIHETTNTHIRSVKFLKRRPP